MTELSAAEKIIVTLVDNNGPLRDDVKCNHSVQCQGIPCGKCPLNDNSVTLGDIRKLDPRSANPEPSKLAPIDEVNPQEYTGGSSSYYTVDVKRTTTPYALGYTAECNDIIEALGMNFAEGNAFKALWRRAAQRTLGKRKVGAKDDGLYDAEKVEFFGKRLVEQSKAVRDAKTE